jgi:hypothetical protein
MPSAKGLVILRLLTPELMPDDVIAAAFATLAKSVPPQSINDDVMQFRRSSGP